MAKLGRMQEKEFRTLMTHISNVIENEFKTVQISPTLLGILHKMSLQKLRDLKDCIEIDYKYKKKLSDE